MAYRSSKYNFHLVLGYKAHCTLLSDKCPVWCHLKKSNDILLRYVSLIIVYLPVLWFKAFSVWNAWCVKKETSISVFETLDTNSRVMSGHRASGRESRQNKFVISLLTRQLCKLQNLESGRLYTLVPSKCWTLIPQWSYGRGVEVCHISSCHYFEKNCYAMGVIVGVFTRPRKKFWLRTLINPSIKIHINIFYNGIRQNRNHLITHNAFAFKIMWLRRQIVETSMLDGNKHVGR